MHLVTHLRFCVALVVGAVAAARGAGQVTFTVTGTADATAAGYNVGQAYTFVFTAPASYPNNIHSTFFASENAWRDEDTGTSANLFTSLGGSGLTGTFVRPTNTTSAPFSFIRNDNSAPTTLELHAGNDAGGSIGLSTPDTSVVGKIHAIVSGLATFAYPASYSAPDAYFSAYTGTDLSVGGTILLYTPGGGTLVSFTPTQSMIAVPEPSAGAALVGTLALGLAAWRRRHTHLRDT